jgi:copper chaperone NosL
MTMKRHISRVTFQAVLLVAFVLAACAPPGDEPQPPEIAYGLDICEACGMIIDEPRFAGAMLLDGGETLKFDDIGEMFTYHVDHPELEVRAWFVHDYDSERWVHGENAFYVMADMLKSPMGHGVAAFGAKTAADEFAIEHDARVLTFDEMRAERHVH